MLAAVAFAGTSALGVWQYSRAHRDDISAQVLAAPAVPLRSIVHQGTYVPEEAFGRLVTLPRGRLWAASATLTCDRRDAGAGCWIIAPIYLANGLASVGVLGFTPEESATSALEFIRTQGTVIADWVGRLQPAEVIDKGSAFLRPSDEVASINVNELAMRWNTALLDGYVMLEAPAMADLQPVSTSTLITPPSGITWRNLIYAWQWWAFAAFVAFLLARYLIDIRRPEPVSATFEEQS